MQRKLTLFVIWSTVVISLVVFAGGFFLLFYDGRQRLAEDARDRVLEETGFEDFSIDTDYIDEDMLKSKIVRKFLPSCFEDPLLERVHNVDIYLDGKVTIEILDVIARNLADNGRSGC